MQLETFAHHFVQVLAGQVRCGHILSRLLSAVVVVVVVVVVAGDNGRVDDELVGVVGVAVR